MDFSKPIVKGTLVRRYKRFLADVELENGELTTVHCANPGAMAGLADPGLPVICSTSPNTSRKLPLSLEMVRLETGWVGINTSLPNKLVAEALAERKIAALAAYESIRPEFPYGTNSRVDFLLSGDGQTNCYVEVKNVHFSRIGGLAEFPDSPTARGAKHLGELAKVVEAGHRAIMLYVVQRDDCASLSLAPDFDPAYVTAFKNASSRGVETLAFACHLSEQGISLGAPVEFIAP
ncbi:MAG: DNA/RNA nuclease SfsA [Hyphomicrobiaceae bacterium]|nr:DNA/RNA nuclease SfsA [Hyphomicrobiaceae bacterium]